ncbi:shikimate dehydrogenase [Microbacterium caowuchunii]|uniref:shikimate dehydrogenase family protein n=1 Tax=Microbacterium caowuchunii TaxID=2614638 RepID=UPI001246E080|nr:shikimate dehydrogenase [Microbacterium caowuchunii]QEW00037.1 shikimate dehydrogenase [Microbacterium caowuchunii]
MLTTRRLAVWGDPIEHSRSPRLHTAAYRVLGFDWTYDRRRVDEAGFPAALDSLGPSWLGLSLTMPLKGVAYRHAVRRDRHAQLTGAVNTYLLGPHGPHGFNTDVGGIVGALTETGHLGVTSARIVGTGATATSALVALHELGVRDVDVAARRPDAAHRLAVLGEQLGVRVTASALATGGHRAVPLTIATLPGDADLPEAVTDGLATAGGTLFDVVYGTWPTVLGAAWERAGLPAASGLGMLLHQAIRQIRVFANGDPDAPLPDEAGVLAVMRREVMGD